MKVLQLMYVALVIVIASSCTIHSTQDDSGVPLPPYQNKKPLQQDDVAGGTTEHAEADLAVTIAGPEETLTGTGPLTYTATVTNHGPKASGVTLWGGLGSTSVPMDLSQVVDANWECQMMGKNQFSCQLLRELRAGENEKLSFVMDNVEQSGRIFVFSRVEAMIFEDGSTMVTDPDQTNNWIPFDGGANDPIDIQLTLNDSQDPVNRVIFPKSLGKATINTYRYHIAIDNKKLEISDRVRIFGSLGTSKIAAKILNFTSSPRAVAKTCKKRSDEYSFECGPIDIKNMGRREIDIYIDVQVPQKPGAVEAYALAANFSQTQVEPKNKISNNRDRETTKIHDLVLLDAELKAPKSIKVTEEYIYTVTVKNPWKYDTGVLVTGSLGNNDLHSNIKTINSPGWNCNNGAYKFRCTRNSPLSVQSESIIEIKAVAPSAPNPKVPPEIKSTVQVMPFELFLRGPTIHRTATTNLYGKADLAVISLRDSKDPVLKTVEYSYTVKVKNNGPHFAHDATLLMEWDSGNKVFFGDDDTDTLHVKQVTSSSPAWNCTKLRGGVIMNIVHPTRHSCSGGVAMGETIDFSFKVRAPATWSGKLITKATAQTNNRDKAPRNNSKSENTTITETDLELKDSGFQWSYWAARYGDVNARKGAQFTIPMEVKNNSPLLIDSAVIRFELCRSASPCDASFSNKPGLTGWSCSQGKTPQILLCEKSNIQPNTSETIHLNALAASNPKGADTYLEATIYPKGGNTSGDKNPRDNLYSVKIDVR